MATPLRSLTAAGLRCVRTGKSTSASLPRPMPITTTNNIPSRPFTATAAIASSPPPQPKILLEDRDSGFGFVRHNSPSPKPRTRSVTEIRGPYYTVMGQRYLSDVLETMGTHVDGLKFAGGSFALFAERPLRQLLDLAHAHGVYVSTGGWIEHVLASSGGDVPSAVDMYLAKCKDLGFDEVELSTGFLSLPPDDWLRLAERVQKAGMEPKPELGIQFGAGGDTPAAELQSIGTSDPSKVINMAKRFVKEAGVKRCMIESEGITENVQSWRTDVIQAILRELPLEKVMFEAADPEVFNWYIREFGVDVNLFVDHSQIVQLAGLKAGIWGKSDTFGKITTYRPPDKVQINGI
ncbi:putative sulfonate biosynthesis enzyme [Daldinia vernicosa]|uniref:putative sulfonate biosynthesis enzyme n=1 Tax=Daldinia vernicosa TaxID=114800 RepID=UPI00200820B1|nr:putative sulfonate biosynthesis enzyme [Daldinia vernicosa]KAI0853428.1 putative sulfonate biosynthesis enzyme [Daldinia vernicosa]